MSSKVRIIVGFKIQNSPSAAFDYFQIDWQLFNYVKPIDSGSLMT